MVVKVAPSLLAADFLNLGKELEQICNSGADLLHLDIMDGIFVPNISYGAGLVTEVRKKVKLELDVHLMVSNPERMVDQFYRAGADRLTVHVEACIHLDGIIKHIKSLGMKAGIAINPATSENTLNWMLDEIDQILVMTINPGAGGQKLIDYTINKIQIIKNMISGRNIQLIVDGGVNLDNRNSLVNAGVDVLVAGTTVFKSADYRKIIEKLKIGI